jgi:predicted regulator of Ras-like GTPase activity (Roadblock/LC7/MglB family)
MEVNIMPKTKTETLTAMLKALQASTSDIEASAVVSVDGLMIASALPADVEEDRVAAMAAAMLSLGERSAKELSKGELDQVYVKGEDGYILLMSIGKDAVLTALARKEAKLGLVFLDMKRTAEELKKVV